MNGSRHAFVISLPHCGRSIPEDIRRSLALSEDKIEESTDIGTEEVFGAVPALKVLRTEWSRLTVDLNRDRHQRGEKGVVALVDYGEQAIYRPDCIPGEEEIQRRIKAYYLPYHLQLQSALKDPRVRALFDCHSMNGIGPAGAPDPGKKRKDLTLSNNGDERGCSHPARGGITCPPEMLEKIRGAFEACGFSVAINFPYSGGFITTHYGDELVRLGRVAVQIELNQDLYCKPGTVKLLPEKLADVRKRILDVFKRIGEYF